MYVPHSPTHHVTPHNSGQPLRPVRPSPLHPYLCDVNGNHIAPDSGMLVVSYNSATPSESDTNTTPLCPKTSSVAEYTSESAAPPAAGNASGDCICLEYIGDNGPCPVHGKRGAS